MRSRSKEGFLLKTFLLLLRFLLNTQGWANCPARSEIHRVALCFVPASRILPSPLANPYQHEAPPQKDFSQAWPLDWPTCTTTRRPRMRLYVPSCHQEGSNEADRGAGVRMLSSAFALVTSTCLQDSSCRNHKRHQEKRWAHKWDQNGPDKLKQKTLWNKTGTATIPTTLV